MNCHILINANLVIRCCKKLVFEFTFDFSTLKQFDIVIGMYENFFYYNNILLYFMGFISDPFNFGTKIQIHFLKR